MLVGNQTYSSAIVDAKNYMFWILESFGPNLDMPILEIGVGHGSYAPCLHKPGHYVGIDLDEVSIADAKKRYPDIEFLTADISGPNFAQQLDGRKFKSIICLNVLEHISDHNLALVNLGKALLPGGNLFIIVPALSLLFNDLDRLAGHYRRYSRPELRELIKVGGLEPIKVDYFNPIGGLGWLANSFMQHHSLDHSIVNSQIIMFDRWLLLLSRRLNILTKTFFGQSVLAIGHKSI